MVKLSAEHYHVGKDGEIELTQAGLEAVQSTKPKPTTPRDKAVEVIRPHLHGDGRMAYHTRVRMKGSKGQTHWGFTRLGLRPYTTMQ